MIKQSTLAMLIYAGDAEGLPPADGWIDRTFPYAKTETVFRCPEVAPKDGFGFAMNDLLSSRRLDADALWAQTPLLFESSNLSRSAHDPLTSLLREPRHQRSSGVSVGFADGAARMIPEREALALNPRSVKLEGQSRL
jgi:hypothetical protein